MVTKLRMIRKEKKIGLTALAQAVGIIPSRLSMIESGQRPVSPDLAQKIATALEVDPAVLFLVDSFTVREVESAPDEENEPAAV